MVKNDIAIQQEHELLSRLKGGDKEAFNVIFHKYYQPLCTYAYQFVVFEDVEEIVQDMLLWIWQNRDTLYIKASLSAYLYRAVHLRCLSCIAQSRAKQRRETRYWQHYAVNMETDSGDYQVADLLQRIHEAINRLPEKFREAFVKNRFENRSYNEIAQELNVSPKTIDYRIQQALKLLREDLRDYFPLLLLL